MVGNRWLSGIAGAAFDTELHSGGYAAFRHADIRAYRRWLRPINNMRSAGTYLNGITGGPTPYEGVLDYAIGGPMEGHTWHTFANDIAVETRSGNETWPQVTTMMTYSDILREQCRAIHANWGNLKMMQLSMAHEINGQWYEWSANGQGTGVDTVAGSQNALDVKAG